MKFIVPTLLCFLCTVVCLGQLSKDDLQNHLQTTVYAIDSQADALVLYESESVEVIMTFQELGLEQYVHKTIKILREEGVKEGNISIPFIGDNFKFNVDDLHATTYNLEGGNVVATKLSQKDFYKKQLYKDHYELQFALPKVRVGSVIDYSYKVILPFYGNIPEWNIQEHLPKLYSDYRLHCNNLFSFSAATMNTGKMTVYKSEKQARNAADPFCKVVYQVPGNLEADTICCIRRNVPGYHDEPLVWNINNNVERMAVIISGFADSRYNASFVNNWQKVNNLLKNSKYFGGQVFDNEDFVAATVRGIIKDDSTKWSKMRHIYNYVRANFVSNGKRELHCNDLKQVLQKKEGSPAEINLVMTVMMRKAGIDAYPVVISTTNEPSAMKGYPVEEHFDYAACAIKDRRHYTYLDASSKWNRFGVLPSYCYNGYARIVSENGDEVYLTRDSLEDNNSVYIKGLLENETNLSLSVTVNFGKVTSGDIRRKLSADGGPAEKLVEEFANTIPGSLMAGSAKLLNLDNADTTIVIKFGVKLPVSFSNNSFELKSSLVPIAVEHSLAQTRRKWPIEYANPSTFISVMDLELPDNVVPGTLPPPLVLPFDEGGMSMAKVFSYDKTSGMLTIRSQFNREKLTYKASDNQALQDYYIKLKKEENSYLSLKKQ